MKKFTVLLIILSPFFLKAQETGIHFEHGLSWEQVKSKAKTEHKWIFMDCYATWCGPCKAMAKNIFPRKEVGEYFNKNFINIKMQMDTTANDNAETIAWRSVGNKIMKDCDIRAFPTFVVFDENGNNIHKFVGATAESREFINAVNDALDSNKQYFTIRRKYNAGDRDPQLLRYAASMLLEDDEKNAAYKLYKDWLIAEKNIYSPDGILLIAKFTRSTKDTGFALLINQYPKIQDPKAKQLVSDVITQILVIDEVMLKIDPSKTDMPWDDYKANIVKKYPSIESLTDKIITLGKFNFYKSRGDKERYVEAMIDYINLYETNAPLETLNSMAWEVFTTSSAEKSLQQAMEWSKRTLKDSNAVYIDTYANILYKLGKKSEALDYENKAINIAVASDKNNYVTTLDKMKKGEKTWE